MNNQGVSNMSDNPILEKMTRKMLEEKQAEQQIEDRLTRFGFDVGQDKPDKQSQANDVIAATAAVKGATQHFIENSAEARKARALAARSSDSDLLGESTGIRDYKKPIATPTVREGHNVTSK